MKKLLKKDSLLIINVGGLLLCPIVACLTPVLCCMLYRDIDESIVSVLLGTSFVFLSPMIMCVIVTLLLTTSFAIELKDKTIVYLLANGFRQQDIWLCKLLVAAVYGYLTMVASFFIYLAAVYLQWRIMLSFSIEQILLMFVILPFISLVFSAVLWLLMWVTKTVGTLISGIFPMALYMFSMYFCQRMVEMNIKIGWGSVIGVIAVTVGVLYLISVGVNRVDKEYWVNVHK